MGRAFPIRETAIEVTPKRIADAAAEWARFCAAKERCADQIMHLMDDAEKTQEHEVRDILDFQYLILEDADFLGKIEALVCEEGWNCAYAVKTAAEAYRQQLLALTDNAYLRERAADIADLTKRLLCEVLGIDNGITEPGEPYIAIAADLTPSQITGMDSTKLVGIVLEKGAMTSHTVIIARSRGIPCLIGVEGAIAAVCPGAPILIDGFDGMLHLAPDAGQIARYEAYQSRRQAEKAALHEYRSRETCTRDGFRMKVYANITSHKDIEQLLKQGGEGVGLFRTELLYMESTDAPPSEEVQFTAYRKAAEALAGRPLIIRTLDVGGDKEISYLGIPREDNPFLGYRAIRYCLDHKELFRTQISAILRASAYGKVQIMFPMISTMDEVNQVKGLVDEIKEGLATQGIPFDRDIALGMMVETPAAVIDAQRFAQATGFFSIGTNDLTQYLFAADRTNAMVSKLNSYFHPCLLRAVSHVVECARAAGIEVDICGQAGEVPELVPLWIGMGMHNLSVSIPAITKVRRIICESERRLCQDLLCEVLALDTEHEVRQRLMQTKEASEVS